MSKLLDLIDQDYKAEVEIIRKTGNIWGFGVSIGIGLVVIWLIDTFLFGDPWDKRDFSLAMITVIALPFIARAWERHKVATKMRHEREIRVEAKVDALLETGQNQG